MTRDWEPIEKLSWTSRPLIGFRASRAAIEDRFGKPRIVAEDSNGLGPFDAWLLRFECGLEIALWLFYVSPDGTGSYIEDPTELGNVEVHANRAEEKHILFHIGIEPNALSHWEPSSSLVEEPLAWRVLRQDDNGNVNEMARYTSRCEADAVAATFEARGHKQTYFVDGS